MSNGLTLNVIERIIISSNVNMAKVHSNIEANEINKILDAVMFTDEENEEFGIRYNDNMVTFNPEKVKESIVVNLSKQILNNLFEKYINNINSFDTFLLLSKLANIIKPEFKKGVKFDTLELEHISDVKTVENFMIAMLGAYSAKNWPVHAKTHNITIEMLRDIASLLSHVSFSEKDVEDYDIKIETENNTSRVVCNLDEENDIKKLNKLKKFKLPVGLKDKVSEYLFTIGMVRDEHKLAQKLNIV